LATFQQGPEREEEQKTIIHLSGHLRRRMW
jgi:hypothetical protein